MSKAPKAQVVIESVDKATRGLKAINERIAKISAPLTKVNRAFKRLNRESGMKDFNKQLRVASRRLSSMRRQAAGVAKVVGVMSALTLGSGYAAAKAYADSADALAKLSVRTDFSVEALQQWDHAARLNGVTSDKLKTSLGAFSKRMGELRAGTGGLYTMLQKANPKLIEQLKATTSNEKAFELMIDAMRQYPDAQRRNALAAAAFSRNGLELVNVAAAGADQIAAQRQEMVKLGQVSTAEAKAAEKYNDAQQRLGAAMLGMRNIVMAKVIPVFTPLIDRLTELAVSHGPAVSAWADGFAKDLPGIIDRVREGFADLGAALKPLVSVGAWVSENFGIINAVMTALAVIISAKLIIGVVALAGAIQAMSIGLAATPIGWIIAGIAALVTVVVLLVRHWDSITEAIKRMAKFVLMNNPFSLMLRTMDTLLERFTGFSILDEIASKLRNLLPAWAVDLIGKPVAAQPVVQSTLPGAKSQFNGKLDIKVHGGAEVQAISSDNPAMQMDADAGLAMPGV